MKKTFRTGIVIALSGFLAACASSVDLNAPRSTTSSSSFSLFEHSEFRCDADPAQRLTGQTYTDALAEQARKLSGSKLARTLRPGQVITMEYNPERINIRLDERNTIATIGCG